LQHAIPFSGADCGFGSFMNWALSISLAALGLLALPLARAGNDTVGAGQAVVSNHAVTNPAVANPAASQAAQRATGPDANAQDLAARIKACSACHGEQGRATSDGFYPRIAGKPAGYLYNQLRNFRDGRRKYPLMSYLVQHLSDDYLREIADYFSNQHPPYPAPATPQVSAAVLQRGRLLVQQGDPKKQVPACIACHGQQLLGVAPAIPGLLGLPHDYLSAQFGAWQNGVRHAAAPDCMATITSRLSLDDIAAASAWLAAQPVPANPSPASVVPHLPLACGSVEAKP
jgi:cytochrome c553